MSEKQPQPTQVKLRSNCGGEPWRLTDDQLNLYLAMKFRSCIEGQFLRGEKP
jgi:hypothetical protein